MARHGVSIYRAVDDRRARWAEEHPREARIMMELMRLGRIIQQWEYQIAWADSIMDRTGRIHNDKSWNQRERRLRTIAELVRMRGAWELKLMEVQG